jgi:predicted lysophospholipase L1 biosynthesis ABC-type transport system permease subunit
MRIPIEAGRAFTDADGARSRLVAIVNRRLAEMLWPGENPIGRRFSQAGRDGPWMEVVGVTPTGRYRSLFEDPQPYFYVPVAQEYSAVRVLHVRTNLPPEALAAPVERVIHNLEPALPLYDLQSMNSALNSGYGLFIVRTGAWFAAVLGLIGMSLALIGLYGIVAHITSQRTHEIGVRIALGANSREVAALVIGNGVKLALAGLAVGLIGAGLLARMLSGLLFGLQPMDPASFTGAAALVLMVTGLATYLPARHATRVDPMIALHAE